MGDVDGDGEDEVVVLTEKACLFFQRDEGEGGLAEEAARRMEDVRGGYKPRG